MTAGRVGAHVGKVEVERDENPLFSNARRQQLRVPSPRQSFTLCSSDVAAQLAQRGSDAQRDVLVELEPQVQRSVYAGIGTIRSRASSAA